MAISGIYLPSVYANKIYHYGHDASAPVELVTGLDVPKCIHVSDTHDKIFFTDFRVLKKCDLDGSNVEMIVEESDMPSPNTYPNLYGVGVAEASGLVFFADSYYDRIMRCDTDGNGIEVMWSGSGTGGFGGQFIMKVDQTNEHVYWTTRKSPGHPGAADYSINRMDYDGGNHVRVAQDTSMRFFGLALDVDNSTVYWTDYINGKIESSGIGGGTVTEVLTPGLGVIGLDLDIPNGKVYWTNAVDHTVMCDDLAGGNTEVLASGAADYQEIWDMWFGSRATAPGPPVKPQRPYKIKNRFWKTDGHSPTIIGDFVLEATTVTIEVWDIVNGINQQVTLTDANCYEIGNSNKWAWSMENLPLAGNRSQYQFYFRMTSDTTETIEGEFILRREKKGYRIYDILRIM